MTTPLRVARHVWTHPSNRGRRVAAMRGAIAWQMKKRLGRSTVISVGRDIRLKVWPDSTFGSGVIYASGRPDPDDLAFIEQWVRPGDSVVDGGSNIGYYTVRMAELVGAAGHVHAVEADERNAARTMEQVEINGASDTVTIHQVALGDHEGETFLDGSDAIARLARPEKFVGRPVSLRTLDALFANTPLRFVKLDLEGAEGMALTGASGMLAAANPPVWQLEMNNRLRDYGWTQETLASLLRDYGFTLCLYDADEGALTRLDEPWRVRPNVLAVHPESTREELAL
ncbi:MAG: FkbM family methyltransferase [Chloroflexota bacterium]